MSAERQTSICSCKLIVVQYYVVFDLMSVYEANKIKYTIPVEAEVIQFAANCSRCEVVIPQLIDAVSWLLIPHYDTSTWVTVFTLDIQHESVQSTSDAIVWPCRRVAWSWKSASQSISRYLTFYKKTGGKPV